jgi:inward rectifier potassium channel
MRIQTAKENNVATQAIIRDEDRDLGFGSVVSETRNIRLLNKDGSFNVTRKGLGYWESLSLYHSMLTMGWTKFFSLLLLGYLVLNVIFAAGYLACGPDALTGYVGVPRVLQAFFFSIDTFATIGYGNISPIGIPANIMVTVESFFGLLWLALATGLLFARFSRPTAKIIFSKNAVIAPYKDITAFMFRITNARKNQLIEVEAKLNFSRFEMVDGHMLRRFYQLALERQKVVFFPLSWTVVHPIDEKSPLYGWSDRMLKEAGAEFLILLTGIDETFSQQVHARSSYSADEIVWSAKFRNLYDHPEHANLAIDLSRFHAVEPAAISSNVLQ